ncbi:hypothetical protein C8J57DRAFT_1607043 [Mycena rebaudengoi]|nr:hypothetical protein C8J57DRAFT_1607043 [Mycena rebaudengoi]
MFSKSLICFASIAAASALAVAPTPDAEPKVTLCGGSGSVGGCAEIPLNLDPDDCHDLTASFKVLNDNVFSADIPFGTSCRFYDNAGCLSSKDTDVVFLSAGLWNFLIIPGTRGIVDFHDRASSFDCS